METSKITHRHTLNKRDEVLGKEFETNSFGRCFIIDYAGVNDVKVAFYDPFCIVKCSMLNLKRGAVANPMKPTVYGKGYLGVGNHSSNSNVRLYKLWKNMLERVYCLKTRYRRQSYEDIEVCEDWHNFQNFAEWCLAQEHFFSKDSEGRCYQLDKDILLKGNKIYSPDTCCFVPLEINTLLISGKSRRGDFIVGVGKENSKYKASVRIERKNIYLGVFETPYKAFEVYKETKEAHIKCVADKWKNCIDQRVYHALMTWRIAIDD